MSLTIRHGLLLSATTMFAGFAVAADPVLPNTLPKKIGVEVVKPADPDAKLPAPLTEQTYDSYRSLIESRRQRAAGSSAIVNWNPNNVVTVNSTYLQPFTTDWYAAHPTAWRYNHPTATAWTYTTVPQVTTWLNVPVAKQTVVANGTFVQQTAPTSVVVPQSTTTTTATTAVVPTTSTAVVDNGEWMSLGVFALSPTRESTADRMMQLAVNRDGVIRGTHYDIISDDVDTIQGAVDKVHQRVAWTIGAKGPVVFDASLDDLTADVAMITAHLPDGRDNEWKLTLLRPASTP